MKRQFRRGDNEQFDEVNVPENAYELWVLLTELGMGVMIPGEERGRPFLPLYFTVEPKRDKFIWKLHRLRECPVTGNLCYLGTGDWSKWIISEECPNVHSLRDCEQAVKGWLWQYFRETQGFIDDADLSAEEFFHKLRFNS